MPAAADAALAVPVWDLPVRLVHWGLVICIAFSWWTGENEYSQWHIWSGLTILFLLLFRIAWGFLGSSTARFRSFVAGPGRLLAYLRDPAGWRGIGHTPLGALSVLALLGLIAVQVALGLPLSDEDGTYTGPFNRLVSFETTEWAYEVHVMMFTVLQGFILLHVAAIVFYRLRGQKLVGAMVSGKSRQVPEGAPALVVAGPGRLLLCLAIAGAITGWVASGAPGL